MLNKLVVRVLRAFKRRIIDKLRPKYLLWSFFYARTPERPIMIKLGKYLKVRVYPKDIIGKKIYLNGVFESSCWDFVSNHIKKGMVCFDLGANLGQYTLLAAYQVGDEGDVHSFEPSNRMFKELTYNVELNNLSHRCVLNKLAVSDVEGTAKLSKYEPGGEVYGSLGKHKRAGSDIIGHEEVKTIRIDDYCKSQNIERVDFIKMDIEGAELLALRGMSELLSSNNPPVILLEFADINTKGFDYKAVEIWEHLVNAGYDLYELNSSGDLILKLIKPASFIKSENLVAMKSKKGK